MRSRQVERAVETKVRGGLEANELVQKKALLIFLGEKQVHFLGKRAAVQIRLDHIQFRNLSKFGLFLQEGEDFLVERPALPTDANLFASGKQLDDAPIHFPCELPPTLRDLGFREDDLIFAQTRLAFEFRGQGESLREGDLVIALAFIAPDPVVVHAELKFGILKAPRPSHARFGPFDLEGGDLEIPVVRKGERDGLVSRQRDRIIGVQNKGNHRDNRGD